MNPTQYIFKTSFGGTSSESLNDLNGRAFSLPQPIVLVKDNAMDEDQTIEGYGRYRHDLLHYRYEGREILPQIISDSDLEAGHDEIDEYINVTITKAGSNADVVDTPFVKHP